MGQLRDLHFGNFVDFHNLQNFADEISSRIRSLLLRQILHESSLENLISGGKIPILPQNSNCFKHPQIGEPISWNEASG